MKLLLFFTLCFMATRVFAQIPNQKPRVVPSPDTVKNFKGNNEELLKKQFHDYFERRKLPNGLLGDKEGNIARLPQDHMPCIVPDSATAALMPNVSGAITVPYRPQYHAIPNPALPPQAFKFNALGNSTPAPSK